MLPGVVLPVQFLDNAVGGVDGQALSRPGTCWIGSVKHIAQAPPLVNQLVNHDFTGTTAFACVAQVVSSEIRFIQQAGPVCGVATTGHSALDELESFAGTERQQAIMLGTVIHHRFDRIHRPGGLHDSLMFAAIVKFDGHAAGLNVLPDIVAGIQNPASTVGLIAPGLRAILIFRDDLRLAGVERNGCHDLRQCDFNGSRVAVLPRRNIHQTGRENGVFQAQVLRADFRAALHGGHIVTLLGKSAILHGQLHLLHGGNRHLQHSLIVFLIVAYRERNVHTVGLHI